MRATSSDSVLDFVAIFCLLLDTDTEPTPNPVPTWTAKLELDFPESVWTPYATSMYTVI